MLDQSWWRVGSIFQEGKQYTWWSVCFKGVWVSAAMTDLDQKYPLQNQSQLHQNFITGKTSLSSLTPKPTTSPNSLLFALQPRFFLWTTVKFYEIEEDPLQWLIQPSSNPQPLLARFLPKLIQTSFKKWCRIKWKNQSAMQQNKTKKCSNQLYTKEFYIDLIIFAIKKYSTRQTT